MEYNRDKEPLAQKTKQYKQPKANKVLPKGEIFKWQEARTRRQPRGQEANKKRRNQEENQKSKSMLVADLIAKVGAKQRYQPICLDVAC